MRELVVNIGNILTQTEDGHELCACARVFMWVNGEWKMQSMNNSKNVIWIA